MTDTTPEEKDRADILEFGPTVQRARVRLRHSQLCWARNPVEDRYVMVFGQ